MFVSLKEVVADLTTQLGAFFAIVVIDIPARGIAVRAADRIEYTS